MLFIILALTGGFVGLLSSFFGVGGGVIIVPVLYALFPGADPSAIIGTSLTVIFLNSLINTYNFKKLKLEVRYDWGIILAIGMSIGILSTTEIVSKIEPRQVRMIFSFILFATALRTIFFKPPIETTTSIARLDFKKIVTILLTGVGGGAVAGLTGLGGGIVVVPLLMTLHKLPLRSVPIYSNIAMAGGTLVGMIRYTQISSAQVTTEGFIAQTQLGSVQFSVAILIFIGSFFSSRLGAKLSQKVDRTTSKRLFVLLLIVIGSKILYSTLL